jgi:hypothetical protein
MDWGKTIGYLVTALISAGVVGGIGQTQFIAPEKQALVQMDKAHDACQGNTSFC